MNKMTYMFFHTDKILPNCMQLCIHIVFVLFYICRYIPDVARAIMETLVEIADESPPKRLRYDKEDEELLEKVNSQEVTEMTFRDCLTQHVEQVRKTYTNNNKEKSMTYFFVCFILWSLAPFFCKMRLHFKSHI